MSSKALKVVELHSVVEQQRELERLCMSLEDYVVCNDNGMAVLLGSHKYVVQLTHIPNGMSSVKVDATFQEDTLNIVHTGSNGKVTKRVKKGERVSIIKVSYRFMLLAPRARLALLLHELCHHWIHHNDILIGDSKKPLACKGWRHSPDYGTLVDLVGGKKGIKHVTDGYKFTDLSDHLWDYMRTVVKPKWDVFDLLIADTSAAVKSPKAKKSEPKGTVRIVGCNCFTFPTQPTVRLCIPKGWTCKKCKQDVREIK